MRLAERGSFLGDKLWIREVRKLTPSGHQTALVTTDFLSDAGQIAACMFSRWSQENFFHYMMEHFGIDRLLEYNTEPIPDTTKIVNPAYREREGNIRSVASKLARRKAGFGALILEGEIEKENIE